MTTVKTYPVDKNGNMIEYVSHWNEDQVQAYKDIVEFESNMTFIKHTKGRSSFRFILKDDDGKTWSLMEQCVDAFVKKSNGGKLHATWVVCKRGANYGLLLVNK